MAISTIDDVETPDDESGRGAELPGPPVGRHNATRAASKPWMLPLVVGVLGAVAYAVIRALRSDFDGGVLEVVEWAALGGLITFSATAVAVNAAKSKTPAGTVKALVLIAATLAASIFILGFAAVGFDRLALTIRVVAIAIFVVGGLWVGMNQIFNLASKNWTAFVAVTSGGLAAISLGVLRGNRAIRSLVLPEDAAELGAAAGTLGRLEWAIYGLVVIGGGFAIVSRLPSAVLRAVVGGAVGAVTGFLIAGNLQVWQRPNLEWVAIVISMVVVAGLFLVAGAFGTKGKVLLYPRVPLGLLVGFTFGAWLLSPWHQLVDDAALLDVRIATIVPLAGLGAFIGSVERPSSGKLGRLDSRARAVIFLAPALLFLAATLVVPTIATIVLSFGNREGTEFRGLDNYRRLLGDDRTFDFSLWDNFFTSQLFYVGIALLLTGTIVGFTTGKKRNNERSFVKTGSSVLSLSIGVMALIFAALSVLRGTFFNNLWWVVTVTTASTVIGLTIAVLAERTGRLESTVKSLIFMPMAVSFVGASIVWRLQYQPRDVRNDQTGVLNASWIALGKLARAGEPGNTYPAITRIIALIVLATILGLIILSGWKALQQRKPLTGHSAGVIVFGYLLIEMARRSLGGFEIGADGVIGPETVVFLQDPRPFNNVYLMVILIWIQTGLAMVLLSAAIKAVPEEFIEAAKVDGATEGQTFFNVVLPQIAPTIGVVITTLIVLVTKVFDIVNVTTGGNFGTNVLANDMIEQSFSFFNRGLGAAIAVLILLSVLPVMIFNVRRMQKLRLG